MSSGEPVTTPAFPGLWTEPDPLVVDQLTQNGVSAADRAVSAVMGQLVAGELPAAAVMGVAVRAAVRCLLANGLIMAVPAGEQPEWVLLDPPPPGSPSRWPWRQPDGTSNGDSSSSSGDGGEGKQDDFC